MLKIKYKCKLLYPAKCSKVQWKQASANCDVLQKKTKQIFV